MRRYLKILWLPLLVPLFFVGAVYGATAINSVINPPNLDSGLVGHWTFDGKDMISNVADSSGQGNNGHLVGYTSTTTVAGAEGQALSFDGVNDYISKTTDSLDDFTLSVWFKTDSTSQTGIIFGDSAASVGGGGKIGISNGKYFLRAGGSTCVSVSVPTDGNWHLFTVSRSSGTWTAYKDSVGTNCGTAPGNSAYNLNEISGNGSDHSQPFEGSLDDVRVYNRALSADEVKQLYDAGTPVHTSVTINPPNLDSGLVGHWTFDGKDLIQNATDIAGGNNGDLIGYSSGTTTLAAPIGQGLTFNGTTQYVDAGTGSALQPQPPITVSAWIYATSLVTGNIMGSTNATNGQYSGFQVALVSTGAININTGSDLCAGSGGCRYSWNTSTGLITAGKWYHVVALIPAVGTANTTVYINGVANTATNDGSFASSMGYRATNTFRIGSIFDANTSGISQYFSGSIDDARLYNRALSAAEVEQLYDAGAPVHTSVTINPPNLDSGLVGHWTFDGKDLINFAADSTGNGGDLLAIGGLATTTVMGVMGQAISVPGGSSQAWRTTNTDSLKPSAISVSAWVNDPGANSDIAAIVRYCGSSTLLQNYRLQLKDTGTGSAIGAYFQIGDGAAQVQAFYNVNPYPQDSWHLLTGTYDEATGIATLYFDGVAHGTGTGTAGNPVAYGPTNQLGVGGAGGAGCPGFKSYIDDVRVYDRALSAAEVKQLYELGK